MYSALGVAKEIINYSIERGYSISNLKLQKILYYVQAAFLVERGEKCFNESIVAWEYGPVVEEVYRNYKRYGRSDITDRQEDEEMVSIDFFTMKLVRERKAYNSDDKKLVHKVVDAYSGVENPFKLVKKTHEEEPWKETNINCAISCDKIKNYFMNNKDRIYG